MALDIYLRSDIGQRIAAIAATVIDTSCAASGFNAEHTLGQLSALRAVAVSFGLPWPEVLNELRPGMRAGDLRSAEQVERLTREGQ